MRSVSAPGRLPTPARLPTPPLAAQVRLFRSLFTRPHDALDALVAACGPVCGMGAGPMRMALVGDAGVIAELLARPTADFRWGHKFNVLGFVVGPTSMIVSDGPDHRRRRGAVQAGFSRRSLNRLVPLIVASTDAAIDRLLDPIGRGESGGPAADAAVESGVDSTIDLAPVLRDIVLDVVVRAFFGDAFAGRTTEIGRRFERPQAYLERSAIHQIPHPFPGTKRAAVRNDRRALDAMIDEAIAAARSLGATRAVTDHDDGASGGLIASLVTAGTLHDQEIRDQVVTLFGAGYDTTAASLGWIVWRATTEGWWDALGAEADAVVPDDVAAADEATLAALTTAEAVMRETLRIHPAGALSPRETATDVDVGGYRIRRGTLVLWSAHLAGRDPAFWPDPLRFDPGRFAGLDARQRTLADASWVPFGRGTRNCIGFALAQMELTLIVARMAQRLTVSTTATSVPEPVGMVVNRPMGGVPMQVRRRG